MWDLAVTQCLMEHGVLMWITNTVPMLPTAFQWSTKKDAFICNGNRAWPGEVEEEIPEQNNNRSALLADLIHYTYTYTYILTGTRWHIWLRHCATRSRVRYPMTSMEFFIDISLPATLRSTQPPTEMRTRNISWWVKAVGAYSWPYNLNFPMKSGSLNLSEIPGTVQGLLYPPPPHTHTMYIPLQGLHTHTHIHTHAHACMYIYSHTHIHTPLGITYIHVSRL